MSDRKSGRQDFPGENSPDTNSDKNEKNKKDEKNEKNGARICYGCMTMQSREICPLCGYDRNQEVSPVYLKPGAMLAKKYLIGKVIGHGGFGITYLAYDTVLGIKLAVKEYLVQDYASREPGGRVVAHAGEAKERFEEGIRRFLEEARNLARFEGNPGIVSVRDFFRANGTAYLVMIYLEGMNLRQYLAEKGPMPYERVRQELLPVITGALTAVHSVGMLHRDISPDNIFLTSQGNVRIIDFGAARQIIGGAKSMSIILKPGYAPEEQYRSHGKQGPWTDVYAVAATVYRAITGKVPPESLDRLETDNLEPPSKYCAIPPAQEQVLLKAMSVKAENRYQTMLEFYNAVLIAQDADDDNMTVAYRGTHSFQSTSRNTPIGDEKPQAGNMGNISNSRRQPLPRPQTQAAKPWQEREPDSEENKGRSGAVRATYSIIKILIAIAVILAVVAVAIVLIRLILNQISDGIPDILKPAATTAQAYGSPSPSLDPLLTPTPDPAVSLGPEETPEESPEPTLSQEPERFPDVSAIAVSDIMARGEAVSNALAYVPQANRDMTYGVAYPVGNLIYYTAKPSSGSAIVSRFITDGASLDRGKIEHFFGRDGALYSYTETSGSTALVVPAGAKAGMTWSDSEGNKEIAEVSYDVSIRGTVYENCLVIKIDSLYAVYAAGIGEVAIVDDYTHDVQSPQLRLRYNDATGGSMTPALENISTQYDLID
ncbi:MAG: serine/threonine protein kinase [Christensenellales bacterium]|jgi:serine/threonine protein kinase